MCNIVGITAAQAAAGNCSLAPGVKKLWAFDTAPITAVTFDPTTRIVTDITRSGSVVISKEVHFDTDNAAVTTAMTEGYGTLFSHAILIEELGYNATLRNALALMDKCSCLAIVAELMDGTRVWLGIAFDSTGAADTYSFKPKKNAAGSFTSATALATGKDKKITRTFQFDNVPNELVIVSGDFDFSEF